MYLNSEMAGIIMKEISQVIKEDLNIMNETGLILASTDPERINTFHEGAHILITSEMDQLIVEKDDEYNGCKRGVNLPIQFASKTVGVIGITGDPEETIKYGLIMKKMTEMLLYENFRASELFESTREKNFLISDLIHGNVHSNPDETEKRMRRNGIQIDGCFSVAVIQNKSEPLAGDNDILYKVRTNQIQQEIQEELSGENIHVIFNGELYIALAAMTSLQLYNKIKISSGHLNKHPDISLLCSIGNDYSSYTDIYRSYNEAVNILDYFKDEQAGIYLFNTVMLDFTINQLPKMHKENLQNQIFKDCTPDEEEFLRDFITTYFNSNGSLNQLAEHYFSHKNTIQYKINKILKLTGYDLRNIHDLFVLYMAAICK